MYAIVDIETTGSYAAANGITEISIRCFNGEHITSTFETLVNPGQPIPYFIQRMTGITDDMVASAPRFEEVAEKVYQILQDHVFVAHNVNFDYSFVKGHLREAGFDLNTKKLCTVRLSRRIFPGLPSYSLGRLCDSLGVPLVNHHRAGGDTEATLAIFRKLLANDREQHIIRSLQRNSKEAILPPNVPKTHFDNLPYGPGVYYFHDEKGKVVYVGKARNIRYRVNSHFSNNSESRQKQNFMRHVHRISFRTCGTELMACILESTEIKKIWPAFNSSQKRWEDTYGIFAFEDQGGYLRLGIDRNRKRTNPIYSFHFISDGQAMIRKLVRDFALCPRLCFIHFEEPCCDGYCRENAADYNQRVKKAIASLHTLPTFAIFDVGLGADDRSFVLVEEGKFTGMGYLPAGEDAADVSTLKEHVTIYRENSYIRNLVFGYAARFPDKVIRFSAALT